MSIYIYIMYYIIEMCTRTSCRRPWHFDWGLDTLMTCTRLHSVGRLLDSWTMGTSSVNIGNEREQTWFQLTSLRQGQMRFSNQSWLTYSLSPLRQTFPFFSNSHRDFLSLLSREFLGSVKTSTGNLKEHLISAACYFYILIMPCCHVVVLVYFVPSDVATIHFGIDRAIWLGIALAASLRLDIRIFHPGQTVLKEGEFGEMTYILVHGEARSEILTIALGAFKSFEWHAPWCNRVQLSSPINSNIFKNPGKLVCKSNLNVLQTFGLCHQSQVEVLTEAMANEVGRCRLEMTWTSASLSSLLLHRIMQLQRLPLDHARSIWRIWYWVPVWWFDQLLNFLSGHTGVGTYTDQSAQHLWWEPTASWSACKAPRTCTSLTVLYWTRMDGSQVQWSPVYKKCISQVGVVKVIHAQCNLQEFSAWLSHLCSYSLH